MAQLEVFVLKGGAVDALSSRPIPCSEVSSLRSIGLSGKRASMAAETTWQAARQGKGVQVAACSCTGEYVWPVVQSLAMQVYAAVRQLC